MNIVSLNCIGFYWTLNRLKVFYYIKELKAIIYCLLDTHFTADIESIYIEYILTLDDASKVKNIFQITKAREGLPKCRFFMKFSGKKVHVPLL